MRTLTWTKHPLNKQLARELRVSTHRLQIEEHSFLYSDLKELWASDDEHVICTHAKDPVWQYWHKIPGGSWKPESVHEDRVGAQRAAEERAPSQFASQNEVGTYVIARFDDGSRWIRTRVLTTDGAGRLTELYKRLGCIDVKTEKIV